MYNRCVENVCSIVSCFILFDTSVITQRYDCTVVYSGLVKLNVSPKNEAKT